MARDVRIAILGDSRDFSRAVTSANRDMDRLDGSFGRVAGGAARMGRAIAVGVGAGVVGIGVMAHGFIKAAEESQQVTRQTEAVLQSMGATAWTTADAVADLSTELSLKSGIDDELIQSGQNVLLTFGQVQNRVGEGKDIFDRATEAALNMSVALGTDMNAASMQVGKALNDPIRGLTQLRRVGIQFTEQQEDQIRAMQESGDVAGAQAIMLDELERQFGGSAEAQATASGKLSTAWGNVQEQLGEYLLPIFAEVAEWLARVLPRAADLASGVIGEIAGGVRAMIGAFSEGDITSDGFAGKMERLGIIARTVFEWLKTNVPPIWERITAAMKVASDFIGKEVVPVLQSMFEFVMEHKEILVGAGVAISVGFLAWAASAAAAAAATIAATAPVIAIGVAITALVAGVIWAYKNVDWFRTAINFLGTAALWLYNNVLKPLGGFFTGTLIPAIGSVGASFVSVAMFLASYVGPVFGWMRDVVSSAVGPIETLINALRRLADAWNSVKGFLLDGNIGNIARDMANNANRNNPGRQKFHSGGIFRAPGGMDEGLALLKNGERVLSPAQSRTSGGGGGIVVNVTALDPQAAARAVVDALQAYNRTNGPVPVRVA